MGLEDHQRDLLRAAVDEMIPAGDGMPSASEVGTVEYLDRLASQAPGLKEILSESLAAPERLSREEFSKGFPFLSQTDRVKALTKLENQSPPRFSMTFVILRMRRTTRGLASGLIGYEPHPTNGSGPRMKPFDEAVLAEVPKMPKLYREA